MINISVMIITFRQQNCQLYRIYICTFLAYIIQSANCLLPKDNIATLSMYTMELLFFLVLLAVPFSPAQAEDCYMTNMTFNFESVMDTGIILTGNQYACQDICASNGSCTHFTWVTEASTSYPQLCILFSKPNSTVPYENTISGKASCSCSQSGECDRNGNNMLDIKYHIKNEARCQELCSEITNCNFYTWFSSISDIFTHECFLFSDCGTLDTSCTGCFTGPRSCQSTTPSSSTASDSTTLTTSPSVSCSDTPPSPSNGLFFCYQEDSAVTCSLECRPGELSLPIQYENFVYIVLYKAKDIFIFWEIIVQIKF